jgi:hypothetical protein
MPMPPCQEAQFQQTRMALRDFLTKHDIMSNSENSISYIIGVGRNEPTAAVRSLRIPLYSATVLARSDAVTEGVFVTSPSDPANIMARFPWERLAAPELEATQEQRHRHDAG